MKKAIMLLQNGETIPQLFITIIRYVLPSMDHTVQKLLLHYLEIIEKTDSKGKILPEMILICQNLRNNLQHPNEYICGVTLRFLCHICETEIIEPLIPSILSNLEHRNPYVRRNAILAVNAIYKLPQGDSLLVDAPEMIEKLLSTEADQSAKRNAFLMLYTCAQDHAINYLLTHVDKVSDWGESLQMVVLDLIRKVCRTNKGEKGKYIKIIISLLTVTSAAVIFECAGTLVSLSSAPTAIRAASNTYCQLLLTQSDNNVKLIVLDRLDELKASHRDIMSRELEKDGEYRQMLIQAIHSCAVKFPEVAGTVVHMLVDFLGDSNVASAMDIRSARVCSCALWIISEYCLSLSEVESGITVIKQCLGDLPFYLASEDGENTNNSSRRSQQVNTIAVSSKRPAILADGTYATQSAASETAFSAPTLVNTTPNSGNLRFLLTGDFFLGAVVSCTLTRLVLRLTEVQTSNCEVNKTTCQVLLIIVSMLQLGQSSVLPHPIDNDSYDRIVVYEQIKKIWLQSCHESFVQMLVEKQQQEIEEIKAKAQVLHAQPDDLIDFYHLKSRKGMSQLELEDEVQDDLKRATGEFIKEGDAANKLNRILQLTGFSDPVYAEAYVTVHHYDIVLDVTIINRTKETLQNICLELATMGDLKLVECPQNYTLAAESSKQIKANIKVSSTETGVIFGNIVYETSNVLEPVCSDAAYRNMWAEFEWENKVVVNTAIQDEKEFLDHIIKSTNMKCLTPPSAMEGCCGFLAANLYAKSVFGEDALVNLSVEKQADGELSGYIRIRSKAQGIALSLGDKITLKQKGGA
ncbi:hypothetical protein E3N88_01624 [Mikania micrantha]|uniref:Coatomer subunit beta n=1 Tax=Mikania micrantha TaxID=192012 RepID=A0A5N6Q3T1_9ASTR|nr:hypothetical protein E3N88_01624 [Mikania micrantha]